METSSTPDNVRVLLVDDDEEDYLIIRHLFSSMKSIETTLDWVSSSDEAIDRIKSGQYDAYLIDYRIDGRTGLDVLQEVNALERLEPFILLTGVGDYGVERESLQLAASDYLIKKNLTSDSLAKALYYALGRKEQERQKIEQLLELNRTKDEFISIASHQLRTPATTVKQYVAMVLDGIAGEMNEKQEKLLRRAYESNERQLLIINNLLKVAQVDSGKLRIDPAQVNLSALVQSAVEDLTSIYAKKDQRIVLGQSDEVYAEVDQNLLRMVIDNLLENASKYSGAETVTRISVENSGTEVRVIIADEGVGVTHPERLFQKFSRIENELSTEVGGTGIGLYWAQSIARLHGGDLYYKQNTPKGSKFILQVPGVK